MCSGYFFLIPSPESWGGLSLLKLIMGTVFAGAIDEIDPEEKKLLTAGNRERSGMEIAVSVRAPADGDGRGIQSRGGHRIVS